MQLRNSSSGYGLVARSLHWVIVVGIIVQDLLAEADEDDASAVGGLTPLDWHVSIGITLLALAAFRLAWRAANPVPAWPASMSRFQRRLAGAAHSALYVLLFAIPISGWLLASIEDEPLRFFGLFQLPDWMPAGTEEREHLIEEVHEILFNTLVVLAILHVLGALKHLFIDRDDVFKRMLIGGR